ncbi:MAG: hypothetical protein AB8H86_24405 [Polyangiales bacterium]
MPNAFPYFGHALGSLSRDLQINVVYEQAPNEAEQKLIAQKLGVLGKATFFGAASSYLIGSSFLKAGVLHDPTYDDSPELLEEPAMYEAYGLEAGSITDKAKRMLAYSWLVDEGLRELHGAVPIALVTAQHGSRTQRSPWHQDSLQHMDDALASLESLYLSEAFTSKKDQNYKKRNYLQSPGKVMQEFLRAFLVAPKNIKTFDANERQRLSDAAKLAIGYEKISDKRLFGMRMLLTDEPLEEQIALVPKKFQALHRKLTPKEVRADAF